MKKDTTKANNNKADNKKVLPIGRKLTEADIQALEMRLAAAEAALETEKAAKAALEAKVKTSAKREVKAPDTYDVLQPIFVAIRGSINKGIISNDTIIQIFFDALGRLQITLDKGIAMRLINKTVQHNSCSNIAKADSLASAEGRNAAYIEMLDQCKVLLCSVVDDTDYAPLVAEYDIAYNKAVEKLKK